MKKNFALMFAVAIGLSFAKAEVQKENVCIATKVSNQFMTRYEVSCESNLEKSIKSKMLWLSDSQDQDKQVELKESVSSQLNAMGFQAIAEIGDSTVFKKSVDARVEPLKQACIAANQFLACSSNVTRIDSNLLSGENVFEILEKNGFHSIGQLIYGIKEKHQAKVFVR